MISLNIDKTTHYKGISKFYFSSIIFNIIKLGGLEKSDKVILDFGCGEKQLSKSLVSKKILNYDINPIYSEHSAYLELKFDIVVFNHVLMYMKKDEILEIFQNIKKINNECEFLIGISKGKFLNKLAAFFALNFGAHDGTLSTYNEQLEIINNEMRIIESKKNIFFMTDIFKCKFKISN